MVATSRANEILIATLAGYGVQAGPKLTGGNVFYVDSGHADAVDVVGGGNSWDNPFATIDFAIGQCEASAGDVIYVNAGHTETVDATNLLVLDVAGISIIGLGNGDLRPNIVLNASGAVCTVSADNTLLQNLIFKPGVANTAILVDVDGDQCTIDRCFFDIDVGSYEAVIGVDIGGNDCVVSNSRFISTGSTGCSEAIKITTTVDNPVIRNNHIEGEWADAAIFSDQVFTFGLICNNFVSNQTTTVHAIEFDANATGLLIGNRLYADTAGKILEPGYMKCLDNLAVTATNTGGSPIPAQPAGASGGGGDLDLSFLQTSPGNEWYVDSGATGGDQTGKDWANAFITLDDAFDAGRVSDNTGDVVYLAPGHAENIATATPVTVDKAGVSIVGVGHGADMPTLTIATNNTATVSVTAASVRISNVKIKSNVADCAVGLTIAGTADDAIIENCWFCETSASTELVKAISVAQDADRITIRNNKFIGVAGGGDENAILLANTTDETVIEGNYFWGDWSDYVIDGVTAAGTMLLIKDNVIHNVDTGAGLTIGLHANATGTIVGNRCYGAKANVPIVGSSMVMMDNIVTNATKLGGSQYPPPADNGTLTSGKIFYVDSATGTDNTTGNGYSWEAPFATIDYAIVQNLTTADSGDMIMVAPGHAETLTNTSRITMDIAGVSIIGLGQGDSRPTLTLATDATADVLISADNCLIKNIKFVSNVNDLGNFIDVNEDHFTVEDCSFVTSSGKEALCFIDLATTKDYLTVRNCEFVQPSDPEGTDGNADTGGIYFVDSEHITVDNCQFIGEFETSIFHNKTTAGKHVWIKNCYFQQDLGGAEIITCVTGGTETSGAMVNCIGITPDADDVTEAKVIGTLSTAFFIGGGTLFGNDGAGGQLGVVAASAAT